MRFKNIIWLILGVLILAFVYKTTDATALFSLNIPYTILAFLFFFCSTFLWAIAWARQMQKPALVSMKLNTKALAGFFSPFSIGADALRAYFAKHEHIDAAEALAASFFVKFLKLLLMVLFLIVSVFLFLGNPEFMKASVLFLSLAVFTLFGMFILWSFKTKRVIRLFNKLIKREFLPEFRKNFSNYFKSFVSTRTAVVLLWLLISSIFEILAVFFLFNAINFPLTLTHAFIFAAVANSLALIAATPQGIGFVEGGGYIILSFAFFNLGNELIGTFLITWSIIRVWIPRLIGAVFTWIDSLNKF